MFDHAAHHKEAPLCPTAARPHAERLAVGEAIDVQLRPRSLWPYRVMRWVMVAFGSALLVSLAARIVVSP